MVMSAAPRWVLDGGGTVVSHGVAAVGGFCNGPGAVVAGGAWGRSGASGVGGSCGEREATALRPPTTSAHADGHDPGAAATRAPDTG